jgi:type II secretory pathway pseudopilin PulG
MKKTRYNQRFTLIEMLIVVGIASLLFALLGPAFTRMTQSNAVERHASGLKLGMERARALAVSQRRYVAMILPDSTTGDSNVDKYRYGGYRLAFVTQDVSDIPTSVDPSKGFSFDSWIAEDEWRNSGKGKAHLVGISIAESAVLMEEDTKISEDYNTEFKNKAVLSTIDVDISGSGSIKTFACLLFSPYGDIKTASDSDSELYFWVCSEFFYNRLKIRLNKINGKVEYVE